MLLSGESLRIMWLSCRLMFASPSVTQVIASPIDCYGTKFYHRHYEILLLSSIHITQLPIILFNTISPSAPTAQFTDHANAKLCTLILITAWLALPHFSLSVMSSNVDQDTGYPRFYSGILWSLRR
jgi:hypothetical protein